MHHAVVLISIFVIEIWHPLIRHKSPTGSSSSIPLKVRDTNHTGKRHPPRHCWRDRHQFGCVWHRGMSGACFCACIRALAAHYFVLIYSLGVISLPLLSPLYSEIWQLIAQWWTNKHNHTFICNPQFRENITNIQYCLKVWGWKYTFTDFVKHCSPRLKYFL